MMQFTDVLCIDVVSSIVIGWLWPNIVGLGWVFFAVVVVPAAIGSFLLPESPQLLIEKGQYDKA